MSFTPDISRWVTGTVYNVNDTAKYGKNLYTCITFHTAGTFETDVASGYWQPISEPTLTKNYLTGAGFENNGTGTFSLFNTTLTNKIPTGAITAGAASITTFNTTSSGALAGSYSLQTSIGSGTITAGHGFISNNITINPEDKARVMQVSFSYSAITGSSLMNFSGTSSNTWAVYIYDNANSAWIQPAGVYNIIQGSAVGKCTATFQTPSNATTVRVAIICINANTSGAVAMLWDSFYFGPQAVSRGAAVSDWISYTPTGSWISGCSYTGKWRRVGDQLEVYALVSCSGAVTATSLQINLPSGLSIDTTKTVSTGIDQQYYGSGIILDSGNSAYIPVFIGPWSGTTSVAVSLGNTSSTYGGKTAVTNLIPFTFGAADSVSVTFSVPVSGWSSNTVMSSDTDTRVVAASRVMGTQISVPNSTYTYLDFSNMSVDTHSAWRSGVGYSAGSWTTSPAYVVPVAGIYNINASVFFPLTSGSKQVLITKNGVSIGNAANDAGTSAGISLSASSIYTFNAGDLIQVMVWQNAGSAVTIPGSITAAWSHLEIQRLSGPATIAANETVAFTIPKAGNMTVTTQAAEGSEVKITSWDSPSIDTHGGWSSANSSYTIPVSGTYLLIGKILKSNTTTAGMAIILKPFRNGVTIDYRFARFDTTNAITTNNLSIANSNLYRFSAGDIIDLRIFQNSGVSQTFSDSQFSLTRIGN